MKHFFSKLVFLSMFFVVYINSTNAQTEVKYWTFEIGINTVDVRTSSDLSTIVKDYFDTKEWFGNTNYFASRITAEKYINSNFSIQLAGSINNLNTIINSNDANASYFSIDVNLKHYFNNIFRSIAWFKPYILVGSGFQSIDTYSGIIATGGIGSNFWLNNNIGLNLQTVYKHNVTNNGFSVFQHTVGLVFNFGDVSKNSSRKRLWCN